MQHLRTLFATLLLAPQALLLAAEDDVRPEKVQFRRRAVARMVFEADQNIPGMPKPNWTCGTLYLYHGYPAKP